MAKKQPYPQGVYLSWKDKARLEAIADELGVNNHAVMQYAILDFLKRYEAGEVKPKLITQPVLVFPEDENGES